MHEPASRFRFGTAVLLAVALAGGCATSGDAPGSGEPSAGERVESAAIEQALYDQAARWRGTRYRLGGRGRDGIDCSGLTQVVYRDLFGRDLPRTTEDQEKVGRSVRRHALAPGDLVFFKTGLFQRHVGIYVENGMFLHASRSSGVRLSSLESGYWRSRYWKARRLTVAEYSAHLEP
ncbi:MAG: NlpC/P60 family protein [Gammaproteobacteria bacterium]|nr:NlpC/P60 family protein [Gammaproteobacteria bacterium]